MEVSYLVGLAVAVAIAVAVAVVLRAARRRRGAAVAGPTGTERLRRALQATRDRLGAALGRSPSDVERALPELEEALVSADVGVRTSAELVEKVRSRIARDAGTTNIRRALRDEIEATLAADGAPIPSAHPWVVLVLGVNGVGKTTTVGKLAALHAAAGRRVMVVAADTFRAAAIDQLAVWAERTGAEFIRQRPGANPAAVVFDGVKAAVARGIDVVLIDTAGRLHTRSNLMDELRKVERVIARELAGAPHETLLVVDATTGQNAIAQARTFSEALRVTGIILTKLDGTARGGVAVAIRRETAIPVRYVGIGEAVEDLRPFDAHEFAQALVGGEASDAEFPLTLGSGAH